MIARLLQTFRSPCFSYIRRRLLLCSSIVFLNFLSALLEGISFSFILLAFSAFQTTPSLPQVFPFSLFSSLPQKNLFSIGIFLAIGFQILRSFLSFFGYLLATTLSSKWQLHVQKQILEKILSFPFQKATSYKAGDLVDYMKTPATSFHHMISHMNLSLVSFLSAATLLITMTFLSPYLTLLAFAIFGVFGYSQKGLVKKIAKTSQKLSDLLVEFSEKTVEILNNLKTIFTFAREAEICKETEENLQKTTAITEKMHFWQGLILPLNEISGVVLVGLFLFLGEWTSSSEIGTSLPLLLTFITIIYRLNGRLQVGFSQLGLIAFHWGQIRRIEHLLTLSEEKKIQKLPIPSLQEGIHFHNVSLKHPSRNTPSLKNLTFSLTKGKILAFVGPSGSGKTSILDLLLRFYEPTVGEIVMDGNNIQSYHLQTWRKQFGVLSQDISLFYGTVKDNICLGRKASFEDIVRASMQAGAHSFITRLPLSYDTLIGEKGYTLSGGEKQRLALARALLSNPDILILDEATSHLDMEAEHLFQQTLVALSKTKTIILVAHRLSSAVVADEILVLQSGEIIERGSHQTLLDNQGLYSQLFSLAQTPINMST